jgi:hypothetical protein
VEVVISADGAADSGDLASLRAWLDASGTDALWELAPERPALGTLGIDVGVICAFVSAVEGIPLLIQWIKSWGDSRQESPQITVTITIAGRSPEGNGRNAVARGEQIAADSAGHDHEPDT